MENILGGRVDREQKEREREKEMRRDANFFHAIFILPDLFFFFYYLEMGWLWLAIKCPPAADLVTFLLMGCWTE